MMTYAQVAAMRATGKTTGRTSPAVGRFRWLQTIAGALIRWQEHTVQRRSLQTLDDRMLADLGLTRADAEWESQKPFWQA